MIPEYYKTILVLIIFLIFQIDKVLDGSWEGGRCIYWAAIENEIEQVLESKTEGKEREARSLPFYS